MRKRKRTSIVTEWIGVADTDDKEDAAPVQVDVHQRLQLLGLFCFGFYFFLLPHSLSLSLSLYHKILAHTTLLLSIFFASHFTGGQKSSQHHHHQHHQQQRGCIGRGIGRESSHRRHHHQQQQNLKSGTFVPVFFGLLLKLLRLQCSRSRNNKSRDHCRTSKLKKN